MTKPPNEYPTIRTDRLLLRGFEARDAQVVSELAGAREIAAVTKQIPHPYPREAAVTWIATHRTDFEKRTAYHFAVTLPETGTLVGAASIVQIHPEHLRGTLGYWLGKPYWGRGYGTEAARGVVDFGFTKLGLHRIYANHFAGNDKSGRIMQKLGMIFEGRLRSHIRKWGQPIDLIYYGILAEEFADPPAHGREHG
jgi:RimJ/RimL family protein N-acetyltransferase